MALQKVFKKGYVDYLRKNINLDDYRQDEFPIDESQVINLFNVEHPEGLLEKLVPTPKGDLQSAIAIYEAYPNLTPLVAQQDNLWVYLTHVDLFPYVKQRWKIPNYDPADKDSVTKAKNFVINHWHHNLTNFLRTTFAGLWWNVYLTRDETRENPYELTKVMYDCGQDWRIMRFGELSLVRYRESMIGILEFLAENPDIYKNNFDARGQYISRYFNILGGTQLLSYMDRTYFKNKLESIKDKIVKITSVEQIHHRDISL